MIKADYRIPDSLRGFLGSLGANGRHSLFSVAAAAVCNLVRRHIASEAPKRHVSRTRVIDGPAPASGHLEKAARKTVFSADADHGEVVIPAPGFSRAFHDVEITPTNAGRLTLPLHALSYNRRVRELRALGWKFFTPPKGHDKEDILFGYRGKGKSREVVPLYMLKTAVRQKQDRSLLPSDSEINSTAARAMMAEIQRVARKAG